MPSSPVRITPAQLATVAESSRAAITSVRHLDAHPEVADLADFDLYAGLSPEVRRELTLRADLVQVRLIAAGRYDPLTEVPEVAPFGPQTAAQSV